MNKKYNKFDVFISFKNTNDSNEILLAEKIYNNLKAKNINCFYSNQTIMEIGKSDYLELIANALNTSRILVLIASSIKNVNSEFVKYEWKSFLNEIISDRKKDGEIFIILNGMKIEELPFSLRSRQCYTVNQIDSFYNSVYNLFNETVEINKQGMNFTSIYQFNEKNMKYIGKEQIPLRKALLQFVNNFLLSNIQFCFLFGETGIGITQFLESYVFRFKYSNNIIYALSYDQLKNFVKENKIDLSTIEYIFIDSIDDGMEIEQLISLSTNYKQIKFILSLSLSLEDELYKYLDTKVSFTKYQIPYFSEDEIYQFFNYNMESDELYKYSSLINFIINAPINYIKKPYTLSLIIKALKSEKINTNYITIVNVFDLIELSGDLAAVEQKIIKKIYETKNLNIYENDIINNENFKKLTKEGILNRINNHYEFKDENYFKYKMALYIYNNFSLYTNFKNFPVEFKETIPYYIAILFSKNISLDKFDFSDVSVKTIYSIFDLLITLEESVILVCGNKDLKKHLLDYVSINSENGYYVNSKLILNTCEKYNIFKKDDINAEKFILNYYENGKIVYQNQNKSCRYIYYVAKISYFMDKYIDSMRYMKRALAISDKSSQLYLEMMIEYIDILVDSGNVNKVEKIINKLQDKDVTLDQLGHIKNVQGYLKQSQGELIDALKIYNYTIELLRNDKQNNMLAKTYGDMAITYMYSQDYEKALMYVKKNIDICATNNNYNGLTAANEIYAQILFLQKKYLESYKRFINALIYSDYSQNKWRNVRIKLQLAIIDISIDRKVENIESFVDEINSIDSDEYWPYSYMLLSLIYYRINKNIAIKFLKKSYHYIQFNNEIEKKNLFQVVFNQIVNNKTIELSNYSTKYIESYNYLLNYDHKEFNNYVPFKELKIDEITLAKTSPIYSENIFEYASDLDTTKYMIWSPHKNIYDSLSFLKICLNKEETSNYLSWVIKYQGTVIGMIDMTYNDEYDGYEIGYILSRNYWRRGIMFRTCKMVLSYFKKFYLGRIVGIVYEDNIASSKLLEKLGFLYNNKIKNLDSIVEKVYILDLKNFNSILV